MNVQAVHAVIHTPEQVREILRQATEIAYDLDPENPLQDVIFEKACDLLGARATTFLAPQQVPLDLFSLKANGG